MHQSVVHICQYSPLPPNSPRKPLDIFYQTFFLAAFTKGTCSKVRLSETLIVIQNIWFEINNQILSSPSGATGKFVKWCLLHRIMLISNRPLRTSPSSDCWNNEQLTLLNLPEKKKKKKRGDRGDGASAQNSKYSPSHPSLEHHLTNPQFFLPFIPYPFCSSALHSLLCTQNPRDRVAVLH